jgi:molybdopterin-guanine dinucleotide biosynthesis protein A
MMIDSTRVTLAVLAGGAGTRMGMPKSALKIRGIPILQCLIERLAWQGPSLLVSGPGNERPPGAELFDREVTDPVAGEGPLRGMLTALQNASTDLVAMASVDMPGITREMLQRLIEVVRSDTTAMGAMFVRKIEGLPRGLPRIEPFPCVVRLQARDMIARRLAAGQRTLHELIDEGLIPIAPPADWPETIWTNLNRPEELEAFERSEHRP